MQRVTFETLARYPFVSAGKSYISKLNLTLEELSKDYFKPFIQRAHQRIVEAIERGERSVISETTDPETEFISFPIALILVSMVGDSWLARRWALAETIRCENYLLEEEPAFVKDLLKNELSIRVEEVMDPEEKELSLRSEFKIRLPDFLKLTSHIDALEWKLVNRIAHNGWVYVTQRELVRLVREAIEDRILSRLSETRVQGSFAPLDAYVKDIKTRLTTSRGYELLVQGKAEGMWPPCMRSIKESLLKGVNVGHFGNFALASFLTNIGYSIDEVVSLYSRRSDFDLRIARYQAEHIAGLRGSRTRYTTPSCSTMKTHALCIDEGRLCPKIKNPLQYTRIMSRRANLRTRGENKQKE
ncbi:MAG: DNA primase large subunit PriL [Aigarchaeota archaeon]|nr:DNA primase large subunit PriL [Aigarchaeota archaeon]MDW8092887.1 DNA primase large subunit PriL [Nitrososphaerota archaeon]